MTDKANVYELVPLISEQIKNGGAFMFRPRGISMEPTVYEDDTVTLVSADSINKYDIVLYRRSEKEYVLHRIIKIDGQKLTMLGDNQYFPEYGITKSDVIAKVESFVHNGIEERKIRTVRIRLRTHLRYIRYALARIHGIIKNKRSS